MYRLLQCAEKTPNLVAGFIHVPYSSDQAAAQRSPAPSMALETIAKALRIAGEESVLLAKKNV